MYIEIAKKLALHPQAVKTVLALLDEGCTIPFIARYRKDKTGGMDEVFIEKIQQTFQNLDAFYKRQKYILETIEAQGKLSAELKEKILKTTSEQDLEDLYLPYKQRKKTKADMAREAGLEPLAKIIFTQRENNLEEKIGKFLNEKIETEEAALQGARDIIAEWINEDLDIRTRIRNQFQKHAELHSKLVKNKEAEAQKYKDYFNYSERLERCPSHRIMAIFRGAEQGFLRFQISPDEEKTLEILERITIKSRNECSKHVEKATQDAYKRLLQPSIETEFKNQIWEKAEMQAIEVFAENLKQLLLSSPLGPKNILAIDPGIRTGCKVVCLDENGNLKTTQIIYLHQGNESTEKAKKIILDLFQKYKIEAFAIGDGTAGRETESFIKSLNLPAPIFMVNEDGASVYSASAVAREEFPQEDVTVRGTVSIGRRLLDPLAELVKIDPKAIGVGQYQHDVNATKLKNKLDQTVSNCVNQVGVNLNTASKHLLAYVSGLGISLAENIVNYRQEIGGFKNRKQLKNVPRLGAKAYQQCAGFLRIKNGENILDSSGVHPENYDVVNTMAKDLKLKPEVLIGNEKAISEIDYKKYLDENIGEFTIKDILNELKKPGLDPRQEAAVFKFADNIFKVEDLREGMVIPGIISNITQFGAFVDIGVKQDGLVHISHLANQYVKDPNEVVKLQQKVMVKILEIDVVRKRISLSMKEASK